jgi:UDP-GlcNAc:undecaprenyl-phosphate GlcNAc-1-phosphate transferase
MPRFATGFEGELRVKRNNQLLLPAWYYFLALFLLGFAFFPATRFFFVHTGRRWLYILVLAFSFSALTTPLCRMLATRWGLVDNPSGHKLHKEPTPLLGGAAVFLGFFLPLLINGIFRLEFGAILFAAMILFGIGLLDDTLNLRAHHKLIVQIVLAVGLTFVGVRIILVPETAFLGSFVNRLLSVIWIVGITNAMNFFDGMDGLAAGLGAIISFFLAIVALQMNDPFVGWTALAMMGACLGFLPYNFRPGKRALIFLGDAGSTTIGFVLAALAIYSDWADLNPVVSIFSPLLIFWILIFDMAHITLFRVIRGKTRNFKEWIEYVGHDHLHHRMARVLGGPTQSVLFIYLLSVCLGISAILLRNAHHTSEALLLLSQALIIVVLVSILEAVNGNKRKQ